jgi:hypothetical protein
MLTPGNVVVFAYFTGNDNAKKFDRIFGRHSTRIIAPGIHGMGFYSGNTFIHNANGTWKNETNTTTGRFELESDNGIVVEIPVKIWEALPYVKEISS